MDLTAWLAAFGKLHERARQGGLSAAEERQYAAGREELARAMVAAQKIPLPPGETARDGYKAARALPIDLDLSAGRVRALTLEFSRRGFATLLEKPPPVTEAVGFVLRAPGSDPITGRCRLVETVHRGNSQWSRFAFKDLPPEAAEKMEMLVIDSLLAQFAHP